MDLIKAIMERKSIRAFKPDPVSREKVKEVLDIAINAPSAINLQPWEFTVVMGEEKARLSRKLVKLYREKQISCSPGNVKPLADSFTRRGVASFELMNPILEQLGTDFNRFINEGSCNFYGAPTAIILCLDNAFSKARLVDIGIVLGFITLTAYSLGLGTCPIGLINAYEDDMKELLNIPDNKDVVIGIALGYPDWDSPLNNFKTPRDSLDNFIKWID
ncbi:MAG TPA: nitroreductase [Syntrophorhabdaceae bacterium]|jgi:nitroreductase|nr:nitroreductase [Syntrophorhabdaceae bacterium]HOS04779.1 nitroreductase [Syntrophorhabdaceae bacterium]HPL41755.1 nitroreductase [Syntrophorhabdaceae bacterium]HQM77459.1 nitroreductase [Syntrophorhabdaceae bacterium]HQP51869.1 nitroreductase [Syntrophorhabdaceae bacterium]